MNFRVIKVFSPWHLTIIPFRLEWDCACLAPLQWVLQGNIFLAPTLLMESCCNLLLRVSYSYHSAQLLSHVWLFEIPWTVAYQAPFLHGFFKQENTGVYCHFPPPGNLPNPGMHQTCISCISRRIFFTTTTNWEAPPASPNMPTSSQ